MALVEDILNLLERNSSIKNIQVIRHDETLSGKMIFKVRCHLKGKYQFQIWLHRDEDFQDYAYQFFSDRPILRWDNAPHFPTISTHPHHYHDETGDVHESPLTGRPLNDLSTVLNHIDQWFKTKM